MAKDIILSGIRPTGKLHIGNYLGALSNFVKLQKDYECYFFIADLHSLNEQFTAKEKYAQILNLAKDFLAAGLDPKKCTIFIQSQVPAHSELAVILSNAIPVSYLFRMTQYKEKSTDRAAEQVNAGLLYYPVLMAADILLYHTTKVPVGADQTQHVELASDAAKFFNKKYGQTFIAPRPLFTESAKIMSLLEPDKKMSKTLGDNHCIYIDDEPEIIRQKIAKAITDSGDGSGAGAKNLLDLVRIFGPDKAYDEFSRASQAGNLKYSELKSQLADDIARILPNFRKKKKQITDSDAETIRGQGSKSRPSRCQPNINAS